MFLREHQKKILWLSKNILLTNKKGKKRQNGHKNIKDISSPKVFICILQKIFPIKEGWRTLLCVSGCLLACAEQDRYFVFYSLDNHAARGARSEEIKSLTSNSHSCLIGDIWSLRIDIPWSRWWVPVTLSALCKSVGLMQVLFLTVVFITILPPLHGVDLPPVHTVSQKRMIWHYTDATRETQYGVLYFLPVNDVEPEGKLPKWTHLFLTSLSGQEGLPPVWSLCNGLLNIFISLQSKGWWLPTCSTVLKVLSIIYVWVVGKFMGKISTKKNWKKTCN